MTAFEFFYIWKVTGRHAIDVYKYVPVKSKMPKTLIVDPILGLTSVPSLSTLEGVKKYISEMGNTPSAVAPKQTVMLDWVSKEDGTHLLTITVGNKVKFS